MEPGLRFDWAVHSDPISQATWYEVASEDKFVPPKTLDEVDYAALELVRYKDRI